ncbi:MAG TPA: helix-turn-helix domain-containing protein [Pilimelia sp.]|nr:helix-turn-helix domain-containing protein [Pilimelia sp.]
MGARVLTCLFIADVDSLTAAELVRHLQVSPASVSKAIAFLEDQGLIRRERHERRREHYFVDGDVWYQSTIAGARGVAQVAETARQGVGILGRDTPAAGRLENIARFSDFVSESIFRAAEQVREVLHTKREESSGGPGGTARGEDLTGR